MYACMPCPPVGSKSRQRTFDTSMSSNRRQLESYDHTHHALLSSKSSSSTSKSPPAPVIRSHLKQKLGTGLLKQTVCDIRHGWWEVGVDSLKTAKPETTQEQERSNQGGRHYSSRGKQDKRDTGASVSACAISSAISSARVAKRWKTSEKQLTSQRFPCQQRAGSRVGQTRHRREKIRKRAPQGLSTPACPAWLCPGPAAGAPSGSAANKLSPRTGRSFFARRL